MTKIEPVNVGVIGCGNISAVYLRTMSELAILDVRAVADLDEQRARDRAAEFNVPRAVSVAELLADPEIELVVNLTVPRAHAEVARAALEAGKSVYNEKPLTVNRDDARGLLDLARQRSLLVGGAPDTFLGAGLQTCRSVLDAGMIGEPVAASAVFVSRGMEHWHPDPEFFYQSGAGPMFDMGPYYLTALIALMGPVRRATGSARITFPTRLVTSEPRAGTTITVTTPTHLAGVLDFASGAISTVTTSFDVWGTNAPPIEIYGTEGTLRLPDPNTFGGPVAVRQGRDASWQELPLQPGYATNSRGIGVADMAYALRLGEQPRASGELAAHVLDVMQAFGESSESGTHITIESTCRRPAPIRRELLQNIRDVTG